MYAIDTELAVKNLVNILELKNEAELAEKLQISKNALSMLKKRNSLGTLIEKVLTNIEQNISIDALIFGYKAPCFEAQLIAKETSNEEELVVLLSLIHI